MASPSALEAAVVITSIAPAAERGKKRGRQAGLKLGPTPRWSAGEEEQLTACVVEAGGKKPDWTNVAELLGTGRTAASVEQHHYYMMRKSKQGKPPVAVAAAKSKTPLATLAKQNTLESPRVKTVIQKPVTPTAVREQPAVVPVRVTHSPSPDGGFIKAEVVDYNFDEAENEMQRLRTCAEEGRCYECFRRHHDQAIPYWIPNPTDEGEIIHNVHFCFDCYDSVRNERRRDLGTSHDSDDQYEDHEILSPD